MTRGSRWTESLQSVLGMSGVACQGSLDLFVDHDKDSDPGLCLSLEEVIQTVLLLVIRRPAQEQFRGQPPVGNVDGLLCLLQSYRDSPEVVTAVDVPLDEIALTLRKVRFKAMTLADLIPFLVTMLLMFLIVAVVSIELPTSVTECLISSRLGVSYNISKLADLMPMEVSASTGNGARTAIETYFL